MSSKLNVRLVSFPFPFPYQVVYPSGQYAFERGLFVTKQTHRDRAALERTRTLMDTVVRDALITNYEALIETLVLPDPDDQHVLAAEMWGVVM